MGIGHSSALGFTQLQDLLAVLCTLLVSALPLRATNLALLASFQLGLISKAQVSSGVPFSPTADLPLGGKPALADAWQALVMVIHTPSMPPGARGAGGGRTHLRSHTGSVWLLPCRSCTGAHT